MFASTPAFSGFSVDDIDAARTFYGSTLGLQVEDDRMGFLTVRLATGGVIVLYPKPDHVPATYTVLNFPVDDIDVAVDRLNAAGVITKIYDDFTDEKGIVRPRSAEDGPEIAWFTDPAGNVLSVLVIS